MIAYGTKPMELKQDIKAIENEPNKMRLVMKKQINRKVRDLNIKKSFAREISLATRTIKDKRKYTRKTKHKGEIER